jgi:GAF domain-containing protein
MSAKFVTPFVERLVRLAGEGANSNACSLYLLNDAKTHLVPGVVIGLPESYVAGCGNVEVGTQCCGRAVQHKKAWIVSDMLSDPLFAEAKKAAQESGIRSGFSVPVISSSGEVLGALGCQYRWPYTPPPTHIERNEIFAKLIAFALEQDHGHIEVAAAGGTSHSS